METQAHGESLEKKNLGRRQSYRKMPDISPNLRWAGVEQVKKGHGKF